MQLGAGEQGLAPLAALAQLRQLDLAGSRAAGGGLAALGGLCRLQCLSLERCAAVCWGHAGLGILSRLQWQIKYNTK